MFTTSTAPQTDWRVALAAQIDTERDVREKLHFDIVRSFSVLAARASAAERRLETALVARSTPVSDLSASTLTAKHTKQSSQRTPPPPPPPSLSPPPASASAAKIADLETQIVRLTHERDTLDVKYRNRDEEYRQRLSAMQLLQDDILSLHIELNVAEERINRLTAENSELVKRWMERVSKEAEKLNDANAFLESFERSHKHLRNNPDDTPPLP
ncbi:autophagy protein 16-domain-containing protein [Limtongia smithiae]|uniref:autophagy protein 16-domain-containing protein n=1 Tax=Limtongia smithiae TaxID=1125753 RepID=UPI0034CE6F21